MRAHFSWEGFCRTGEVPGGRGSARNRPCREEKYRLKLPMRGGAESLNAAVAAGIFMYDLMNARR